MAAPRGVAWQRSCQPRFSRPGPETSRRYQTLGPPDTIRATAFGSRPGICGHQRAAAPIQADKVSRISRMTSRSFRPERASTWKE